MGVVLLPLAGCSSIQPWVKPYEREHLADPIMAIDPDPVQTVHTHKHRRTHIPQTAHHLTPNVFYL